MPFNVNKFILIGANQKIIIKLINVIQEIKLYTVKLQELWNWEIAKTSLYKSSLNNLSWKYTQKSWVSFNH